LTGCVDGRQIVVGSPRFVESQGIVIDSDKQQVRDETIQSGATPVLVAVDGHAVAVVGLGDPLREDTAAAVHRLTGLGWVPHVLSGDHPDVVAAVARQLGIPDQHATGSAAPEDKVQYVRQVAASGNVVMVGDGVNDAAALSAATVGIAVHGGAEASLSAADVYLNRPGLTPILDLIAAARNTLRTIHRSLAASLCYNAVAASLAIAGIIGPLTAAVLMPISSFTVLAIAFASRTFKDRT
jgi:Cu2+-exporting ATPase